MSSCESEVVDLLSDTSGKMFDRDRKSKSLDKKSVLTKMDSGKRALRARERQVWILRKNLRV